MPRWKVQNRECGCHILDLRHYQSLRSVPGRQERQLQIRSKLFHRPLRDLRCGPVLPRRACMPGLRCGPVLGRCRRLELYVVRRGPVLHRRRLELRHLSPRHVRAQRRVTVRRVPARQISAKQRVCLMRCVRAGLVYGRQRGSRLRPAAAPSAALATSAASPPRARRCAPVVPQGNRPTTPLPPPLAIRVRAVNMHHHRAALSATRARRSSFRAQASAAPRVCLARPQAASIVTTAA